MFSLCCRNEMGVHMGEAFFLLLGESPHFEGVKNNFFYSECLPPKKMIILSTFERWRCRPLKARDVIVTKSQSRGS